MHPGSTNSRPDPKAPIDRHSLTDGGLEGIYNRATENLSFNAKNAGAESTATNAINGSDHFVGNDVVQKNFKIKQPPLITQFTDKGLKYADTLKVPNTKYAPSGRL